jgi:DNA-binding response OmpR family regulator
MILVVEDDQDTREALVKMLGHRGYDVLGAGSGQAALELMDGKVPDLLILDEMMPGMSGLEMLRQLRKDSARAEIPVILYTAGFSPEKRLEAGRLGIAEWITKGLTGWDEIMNRVRALHPDIGGGDVGEALRHPPVEGNSSGQTGDGMGGG